DVDELLGETTGESSEQVAERVIEARERASGRGVRCNAELDGPDLRTWATPDEPGRELLEAALRSGRLSARGLTRIRRVARAIADLVGGSERSGAGHVAMALQLRSENPSIGAAA